MLLKVKTFFEKIDSQRDRLLFGVIRKCWPRFILPNHLTILRIVIAVCLFSAIFWGFKQQPAIVIIFLFAALLDLLDGSVARALNKTSKIGAVLDSMADKILILPMAVFILYQNYFWLLFFLILPEIFSWLGSVFFQIIGRVVQVTIFGKVKMVMQCAGFFLILSIYPKEPPYIAICFLYLAVLFAFASVALNIIAPPPKR